MRSTTKPSGTVKARGSILKVAASAPARKQRTDSAWSRIFATLPKSRGVIQVNSFDARVELDGTRTLFLERVGARFLDAAKRGLQREAGGNLIDFDDARLNAIGVSHCFFDVARDD